MSTVTMELSSNRDDTSFYSRLWRLNADREGQWKLEGTGRSVTATLYAAGRYDIKATCKGYVDKFAWFAEPIPRKEFKFLVADRIDDVVVTTTTSVTPTTSVMPPVRGIGQRWAVVIGVSEYKDHRIPRLLYAARDAGAFHAWLTSADGGRYAPSRTRLLLDEKATAQSIRNALFEWLGEAIEEDLVTIYFSGHGTPQSPDRPENLFLVPYDADYDHIAATGFPMWDIETALEKFIKARKVVVIADACHAGGIGAEFAGIRRAIVVQQAGLVSDGLQNLAHANDGVAVITSAGSKQLSQESEKWGGGHGVFTYYLLQGLKGQADYNSDSRVTLGELTLYVSEQVRRATKNAQSPEVAGKFDPALTIGR